MPHRIFLITGASSGLGRAAARHALDAGHTVIGTVRTEQAREEFEQLAPGRAHARILDLSRAEDVAAVIAEAQSSIGPVDVLIAAAGYGHEGTVEESTLSEWRRQFDVNVFGTVAVIQAVLPAMRLRRSGHIITITSVGALVPSPTLAAYASSKSALESITRALAAEVAHLGIHVTAVEPGAFRTDWSGRSPHRATRTIPDYDQLIDPISAARAGFNGRQPGDPTRAAAALLHLTELPEPPSHLLLGSDAYRAVTDSLATFAADVEQWRELSVTTDFVAHSENPENPENPENTDGVPSAFA